MNKANDIEYFIEGISAVCNDKNLITKKVKERFGSEYSKLIDYLLLLENEKFNAKAFAAALSNRELEDGFFRFELKCAEKNNLVIVTGYSDDLIELDGAIKQEGDCFNGENFHLEKYNDEWLLKKGNGCNNISAIWYDQNKTAENLEVIPWTYKTEIPHQSFFAKYRGETFCEGFVFSIEDLNMDNQVVL
ncbi:hypothetical protein [Treponema sp. C6A8]|uniref:hypothetical protein n=1 Tax=Treponema sp. C6A8 TaxID=1410609 RepID=UPI0012DE1598|nr:hypothetical protein [Treponema sp. C6A8]